MKEIQEYRKASAEWMGMQIKAYSVRETTVIIGGWYYEWKPDQSYDQMAMMKKKLIKEGCGVVTDLFYTEKAPFVSIWDKKRRYDGDDNDELIAFMKAWIKYNKQK